MLNWKKSACQAKLKVILAFLFPLLIFLFQGSGITSELPVVTVNKPEFYSPLEAGRLSRGFGASINPFTKKAKFHNGLDIAAPQGTSVMAISNGKVVIADSVGGHGNRIVLIHAQGYASFYSHLFKRLVAKDDEVKKGDVIGLVGNTGHSTAPHLHFEMRHQDKLLNPADELDISRFNKIK
jgi:murein DD-endopeptidase MepM/ murein hydrolase activator NlpD